MTTCEQLRFEQMSAVHLIDAYRERAASPVEVVEALLGRIADENPHINALITVDSDAALASAAKAEAKFASSAPVGPLEGIPFTLKDVYATAGLTTTWGSTFFRDQKPTKTAAIARKLKAAGAILIGKGNCPEFAYALYTDNALVGATLNPIDERRVPGGSSGGDAAAVASGMVPIGIGSDLGGSVRVPAHCCGLYGFIASPGRVSNEGHCPAGTPLTGAMVRPGFLTRCVEDLALVLAATEGFNYLDPFSEPQIGPKIGNLPLTPAKGLRCALLDFSDQLDISDEVSEALDQSAQLLVQDGGRLRKSKFQLAGELLSIQRTLMGTGLRASIETLIGDRYPDDSLTIINHLDIPGSADALTGLYAACGMQTAVRTLANALFMQVDVAVLPVLGDTAFELRDGTGERLAPKRQLEMTQANFLAILAGLPAVVVPVGFAADGLPIGVQLIAQRGEDEKLLRAALTLQEGFKRAARTER